MPGDIPAIYLASLLRLHCDFTAISLRFSSDFTAIRRARSATSVNIFEISNSAGPFVIPLRGLVQRDKK
jgi:hypothetical protein